MSRTAHISHRQTRAPNGSFAARQCQAEVESLRRQACEMVASGSPITLVSDALRVSFSFVFNAIEREGLSAVRWNECPETSRKIKWRECEERNPFFSASEVAAECGISVSTVYNYRWEEKNPERRAAHKAVEVALRNGSLSRTPCSVCGDNKTQAHHEDYSQPLAVIWLCVRCHKKVHAS